MLRFLGKKNVAAAIPILATLHAAFDLPSLQGQVVALGKLIFNFTPPSVDGFKLGIGAITAAFPKFNPPALTLKPDLVLRLGLLQAKLDLLLEISKLLLAAGVHVYAYDGKAEDMGTATMTEFTPGPSQGGIEGGENVYAVLLVIEASADVTVKAVRKTFGDG